MLAALSGRRVLMLAAIALVAVVYASPATPQTTGMIKGMVVDAKGQPVDAAKITIEYKEGITRRYETKTNKRGEFTYLGLTPGQYKVTAEKEKVAQSYDARVRLGETTEVRFKLDPAAGATLSKEAAEKGAKIKGLFDEGVNASKAGDLDGAIAKFTEALTLLPECYDCLYNIGYAYTQKKEYDKAEESYKKAITIKPDYADAYNGLATVYNVQKKFAEAGEASNKAAELAAAAAAASPTGTAIPNVDALYNQGVILWNQGKADEAQKKFEEVLKANPNHADARYQLGMTLVNQGKLADATAQFEAYIKLAPDGQYAAQAKAIVAQLKK